MVYIAAKYAKEFSSSNDLLQALWNYQLHCHPSIVNGLDIDKECLYAFEQCLFERSPKAGRAGSGVWGLDCGPLQDSWYPYGNLPEGWNDPNYEDFEEDFERGRFYETSELNSEVPVQMEEKPRPKPCPKRMTIQSLDIS
ncbi:hypothetical protein BDQ17DRAFT_1424705 [Cyathus striatus]|nr:hypothetical protein BDQ17DRAFT_1424705 [Cyathus striatus]